MTPDLLKNKYKGENNGGLANTSYGETILRID